MLVTCTVLSKCIICNLQTLPALMFIYGWYRSNVTNSRILLYVKKYFFFMFTMSTEPMGAEIKFISRFYCTNPITNFIKNVSIVIKCWNVCSQQTGRLTQRTQHMLVSPLMHYLPLWLLQMGYSVLWELCTSHKEHLRLIFSLCLCTVFYEPPLLLNLFLCPQQEVSCQPLRLEARCSMPGP
jgi:hypothetical protein